MFAVSRLINGERERAKRTKGTEFDNFAENDAQLYRREFLNYSVDVDG